MASEADELRDLQAAVSEAEKDFRLEQQGLEEANEMLLKVQQERFSWQQRVEELRRFQQRQEAALHADAERVKQRAAASAAEQQRLDELNEQVLQLRDRLAKQPRAEQVVAEAVTKVAQDTLVRRQMSLAEWEKKQQQMAQNLTVAEAQVADLQAEKAKRLKELLKWRRRMALLRLGRAGSSWKKQRQTELELCQLDVQLLHLRKRLSRKQGYRDEEVALKAMALKKDLEKEAAANELQQEEREADLEQLEDEVDGLKERTAKAKELLRQHTQLNQAIGICPARSASQRIRRFAEACASSESQAHARRDVTETSRLGGIQGQLREVEDDIQRSLRRSQSERRGRQIQAELRRIFRN